jgi:hypothetical protein
MKAIKQIMQETINSLYNKIVEDIDRQLLFPPLRYSDESEYRYAFVRLLVPGYPPFNLSRIATVGADILRRLKIAYQEQKGYTFEVYGPSDAPNNEDGVIWRIRIYKTLEE